MILSAQCYAQYMQMFGWLQKIRKYANFFEAPSKELKEKIVCEEWLNTFGAANGYNAESLNTVSDEWPDCEVKTKSGELCGIEVTELVDSEAIRRNERGDEVYRTWSVQELREAIHERLEDKNIQSHGGKYTRLILLLHTDEFEITFDSYSQEIEAFNFPRFDNIDEAYLVYSYDPNYENYPVSELNLRA